jgi:hypothetical protein
VDESLLSKAFRLAPLTSTAAIAYGLEHAPRFTISALNGLLFAAATEHNARLEERTFQRQLVTSRRSRVRVSVTPIDLGPVPAENYIRQ